MSGNKRLWLSVGLLVMVALMAIYLLLGREPTYQGRTLRSWLQDLNAPSGSLQAQAAREAIATWGTNALPQLVQALQRPHTPVRDFLRTLTGQSRLPLFVSFHETDLRGQALAAFRILGPAAAPAAPRLEALLVDPESGARAAQVLVLIGSNGVERLVGALKHNNAAVRFKAEQALSGASQEVMLIVPALVGRLSDPDRQVEIGAISALQQLARVPAVSVPALIRKAQTPDSELCRRCFTALAAFGPAAKSALPGVLDFYQGRTRAEVEEEVFVLDRIAPEVIPATVAHWLLHTNSAVRLRFLTAAERGLVDMTREEVITALIDNLSHPDEAVRRQAARVLDRFSVRLDAPTRQAVNQILAQDPQAASRFRPPPGLLFGPAPFARSLLVGGCTFAQAGLVRGPAEERKVAFVFTAHQFAEGGEVILNELAKHNGKASFFLTGAFLDTPRFGPLIQRIIQEGHYLGPHSDQHLLYCTWEPDRKTLVSHGEFIWDLWENVAKITAFGVDRRRIRYFLPAYEHYNEQIVDWASEMRLTLVNYTPGTRSNADYTGEADKNFVSSQAIFESIVAQEQQSPNGLNGFLLLLHLGAGPGRSDKFHARFGELLDYLSGKGYQFVSLEELLALPHFHGSGRGAAAPPVSGK